MAIRGSDLPRSRSSRRDAGTSIVARRTLFAGRASRLGRTVVSRAFVRARSGACPAERADLRSFHGVRRAPSDGRRGKGDRRCPGANEPGFSRSPHRGTHPRLGRSRPARGPVRTETRSRRSGLTVARPWSSPPDALHRAERGPLEPRGSRGDAHRSQPVRATAPRGRPRRRKGLWVTRRRDPDESRTRHARSGAEPLRSDSKVIACEDARDEGAT